MNGASPQASVAVPRVTTGRFLAWLRWRVPGRRSSAAARRLAHLRDRYARRRPEAGGTTRVWLPTASVRSDFQRSLDPTWSGNAKVMKPIDDRGVGMLYAEFAETETAPMVELTLRIQTQDRPSRLVEEGHPSRIAPRSRSGRARPS